MPTKDKKLLQSGDKVEVHGIGMGWISRVRFDDLGEAIYTVMMDDPKATPDRMFIARRCELRSL